MKKGKSKQSLRIDWQRRELIRNLEAIFQEGSQLYPLMDEKEVCDKIMTLPQSKAPKNKAELFMVMAANHEKNSIIPDSAYAEAMKNPDDPEWQKKFGQWQKRTFSNSKNPGSVTPAEDGETGTAPTSDLGGPGAQTKSGIFLTSADLAILPNIQRDGYCSLIVTPASKQNLSEEDGNSVKKVADSGSGTRS